MTKFKDREAKEAPYIEHNKDVLSVCSGSFYIKGRNIHETCKNREKCQKYAKYRNRKEDTPEVGFYYVDSFRNCDLWKHNAIDGTYALRMAIYSILYVNDLACACVVDMTDRAKLQDKETQKIFKTLKKRQVSYERDIFKIVGDKIYFLADVNSTIDEAVQCKIVDLRNSILKYLEEKQINNYEFIAFSELTDIIIEYSIRSINAKIAECIKYNKYIVNLQRYKLLDMQKVSRSLCKWLKRGCGDLKLHECNAIKDAFHELDIVLKNNSIIENAILKAEELKSAV